ncbi:hypothetical protein [Streptomyces sp. KR55]|uniref:hypothetical protein n=1 Tax=Streptomyces sp. KR55 TaxID=3457425 RepID=UPI003FD2707C
MAQLIQAASSSVHVDASTVDLVDEDLAVEFEPDWADTGLVAAAPDGGVARVLCGQELGTVMVTAQLWDGAPPPEPEDWQDVGEVSVAWHGSLLDFGTTGGGDDPARQLHLPGPGDYRLRVHGRHRDDGDPREPDAPMEEYLIQMWPAPHSAPQLIKATGETSALWREE